jgi:hypothetical protein
MRRLDQFQDIKNTQLLIGPGNALKQEIFSTKNNFAGIRLLVYNPNLGGNQSYKVSILDYKGNIIREQTVTESNLSWGSMFRFDFQPISDSLKKKYYIEIQYLGKNEKDQELISKININALNLSTEKIPIELVDNYMKKYISIAYSDTDTYQAGQTFLNESKLNGDLVFQTSYQTGPIGYIKDCFFDFTKRASRDPIFFIIYIFLIMTLLIVLMKRILRR